MFGKNKLGYTIAAEDKSRPAIESARGGIQSLDRSLSEIAKNTKATQVATSDLSKSIKGLGDTASREFKGFSGSAENHFALVAATIAKVGISFVAFRSTAAAVLGTVGRSLGAIGGAVAGATISKKFIEIAEAAKRTEAQLKLVTGEGREFSEVQKAIYQSSQSLGQPLNQSIELYSSLGRNLKAAGHDYQTILQLTNSVGLALKAGSVDSVSAAQGIRQLSQAFGAGALRGDEFTSVLENFPRLAQAIADGLGVPIGKLRGMAEEGLLTTTKILDAVTSQQAKLAEEAAKIPLTLGQAFTKLSSSIGLYVADIDKALGVTAKLAGAVDLLASAFTRSEDSLDGAIKRIREATGEFDTFKLSANEVGTALDNMGVGHNSFLELVSNISAAMSDASDKFKLFRELTGTVTAPANMALRMLELKEGSPEERRRRANQVPGASSAAPRFAGMDDDSVSRQAQVRLENAEQIQEAEERAAEAAEREAKAESKRAEAAGKRAEAEAKREAKRLEAQKRKFEAEEKALQAQLERIDEERISERDSLKDRIDGLRATISTELELEEIKYQEKLKLLKEAQLSEHAEILGGAQEVAKLKLRIEEDHAKNIQEIHEDANAEANAELKKQQEENARLIQQPFLNAIDGIQGGFTDAFRSIFSGGVSTFSDFADTVKNIFINLAAEIASLLVFNVAFGGIFGGGGAAGGAASLLGGGASLLGGGGGVGAAGSVLGAGGSGGAGGGPLGLLSMGASKLSSAFGGVTSSINSFGTSLGFGPGTATIGSPLTGGVTSASAGALTPASLSSVLGAAGLSSLGGGLISGALGGNSTVGSVAGGALGAGGYALGATYGASFGPIGAAVGAILGGILGGLIKETPPRGYQISTVGGGVSSQGGKKGFDPGTLSPVSGGIADAILRSGTALGISKKDLSAVEFWLGYSEDGGYNTSARYPGARSNFGDDIDALQVEIYEQETQKFLRRFQRTGDALGIKALQESFEEKTLAGAVSVVAAYGELREQIDKAAGVDAEGLRFGSRVLKRALSKGNVKKAAESADADISFREQFEEITGDADPLKKELKDLRIEFGSLRNRARALGLGLGDLNKVERDRTREAIAQRLGVNPEAIGRTSQQQLAQELKQLHNSFGQLRTHAKALGISISEVNKLEKDRTKEFISERLEISLLETSQSRLRAELNLIKDGFAALRSHAKTLGFTIAEVNKLEKDRVKDILASRLTAAIGSIQGLRQQTGIEGIRAFLQQQKTSEVLAPKDRLAASLDEFRRLRTAARGGDLGAAQELPAAASSLLTIAREVNASGPAFASLFKFVNQQLLNVQKFQEKTFKFPNIEGAIRDAGKEQIKAIKEQTAKLAEEIVLLRRELRRAA